MIAYIDTEVNPQTKKVADYGAVREDGAVLHSHSKADFDAFVSRCDTVCGHNIINHDLKYTALRGNLTVVDTLFLSPLLFPQRPYHHLVKDDKLQVDELNNPVNDSMKARDLLNDEIAAWNQLLPDKQEIYYQLLHDTEQFGGFFKYINYTSSKQQSWLGRILNSQPDWSQLILKEFEGKVCSHADFDTLVRQYPIELAYYVGLTRAKQNLYLVTNPLVEYSSILIALNMRDIILNFFKGRKDIVLRLRSGDSLQYQDGYLLNDQRINIMALSASGKEKLKVWTDKGYEVTSAKVSYTLAWRPQDSETEYAVCLANIVLRN